MKIRWLELIGVVMLASGTWVVLMLDRINPAWSCSAGFASILGLTILLWSLTNRQPYHPHPHSLDRQDDLKELFRGYPR